jgi:dynein light chain roadblock-type
VRAASLRSPDTPATPAQYAANLSQLASKARSIVRDLDPTNDLTFVRVRTKKNEIMIAPEKDFTLMVIQNPSQE